MDWQTFKNFVARALSGDDSVPPVIASLVNAALVRGEKSLESRERDWWRDFLIRRAIEERLREIDALIGKYSEMADWHRDEAATARGRMQEATDRLEKIGEFITGATEVLGQADDGKFQRERAIALLESRGIEIDPNESDASLKNRLLIEQQKAFKERSYLSNQYDDAKIDTGYHETKETENRRKAQELVDKRDAVRAEVYDIEEQERRLKDIETEYKLDIQRKANELESRRQGATPGASVGSTLLATAKSSRDSQEKSEVSDFEAAADALTDKFEAAVTKITNDAPKELVARSQRPGPAGPVSTS